jgi:formate hydrogenlyase subunit 6/NADH:ubiquinone oxidoreductase subunit I
VADSEALVWDYSRPKMSPKEAIFPSTEQLLTIEKHKEDVDLSEPALAQEQIVFGLRPCDAHGVAIFDGIFMGKEPVDTHYARRRGVTTLIGMACPQMWEGCFCTTMGGAPDDASHVDVLLTEVEGGYAVQAVTENGKVLIADLDLQEVEGEPPSPQLNPAPVEDTVPHERWPAHFREQYWELLADRCIGCRLCAYVCPTCRCFDVRDEMVQRRTDYAQYERLRCWDSCTGANYRLIAGGHNPRGMKGQRLRNRFFCKFFYLEEDYEVTGCVGCGRCVEVCPVNIDIVEVMQDVARLESPPTGTMAAGEVAA